MPVVSTDPQDKPAADAPAESAEVGRILRLRVPVIVRLGGRKLPLDGVLRLAEGAVLELNKPSGEPLDLLVNNRTIGQGEAVKVGDHYGLRVLSIGDVRDRVEALGA